MYLTDPLILFNLHGKERLLIYPLSWSVRCSIEYWTVNANQVRDLGNADNTAALALFLKLSVVVKSHRFAKMKHSQGP